MIDIREAKARFSELVERAWIGDEIIIAQDGKPVAKLVPYREKRKGPRVPGTEKGKIWMAEDFDEYTPELQRDFEGSDET